MSACTPAAEHEAASVLQPQVQHVELCAAQRALALFQILGNLHNYDEARCEPDEQDRFAALLAERLAPVDASGVVDSHLCGTRMFWQLSA